MAVEETTIARPYAEAVFRLASEAGRLESWSDMLALLGAVVADAAVARIITDPKVGREDQQQLVLDICADKLDQAGTNLVRLLVANGRLLALPEIARHFERLKSEADGVVDVLVSSAYVIKAAEERMIADALQSKLGKQIRITTEKDGSLIGGVRIHAGDLVIDGSIAGRLRQLATELGI